ncbi:MAG: CDP-alcohol phosphatidyltransferase family protein [Tannerella sp.]|jgi:CDP-diacylglycerol--serine O-phosphatidyltransferase|nr:CDP-alcohol phosphatidyltransferase family protein [Tannerella sp.]
MKGIVRHIPNTLTCISLSFGFYASISGLAGHYHVALAAILAAAAFDFLDGLAARTLKAYSAMGKELDSLSDAVSFGVAPGMILFSFIDKLLYSLSWNHAWPGKLFLLSAFAIPVFSALRLAKFNIDTRQTSSFIGLPVPAHAILWSSVIAVFSPVVASCGDGCCTGLLPTGLFADAAPGILLICLSVSAVATSLLLISGIPMFSLKMSSLAWKENRLQYILILSAIVLTALSGVAGIAATILLYILLSAAAYRTVTAGTTDSSH